jgi:hypothetical protein
MKGRREEGSGLRSMKEGGVVGKEKRAALLLLLLLLPRRAVRA